ncbi:hypothetical protein [Streptomyces nitrosporeus]
MTHALLDELPAGKALNYLRDLLMAIGRMRRQRSGGPAATYSRASSVWG